MTEQQYDNTNRGALFKNDDRKTDKHPEYSGSLNVDGVDYYLSGWIKEGKKGKFFSLSIKRKENQMANLRDELNAKSPQAPARGHGPDPLDEIPFSMEWR